MATMKAYTDLDQSKKLADILPLESADMYWDYDFQKHESCPMVMDNQFGETCICAWSLAALLKVIRETIGYTLYGINYTLNVYMSCSLGDRPWKLETNVYDNEVDACYEMIIKLHELKML
jgi:hypothetical protein